MSVVTTVVISTVIGAGVRVRVLTAHRDRRRPPHRTDAVARSGATYLVADRIHQSGIIATVVAGLVIGDRVRRVGMSQRSLEALDTVWEFFAS